MHLPALGHGHSPSPHASRTARQSSDPSGVGQATELGSPSARRAGARPRRGRRARWNNWHMARIVIVGGGVIGCAVAERLSRDRRHQVLLLERDTLGAHASGAAAGLLAPYSESGSVEFELASRSLAAFPELVERIERSGISVEYRTQETITPALTAEEEQRLQRGPGRWLEAEAALAEEPALSPAVRGASLVTEAQITPIRLVRALAWTAVAQGAEIREGTPVGSMTARAGCVQAVQTSEGQVRADLVVLAAGPWSPSLASPSGLPWMCARSEVSS